MINRTLIIAEAGVNHNGSIELAYKLCEEAKKAGADIVKFQTWKTEKIITVKTSQADYQISNTCKEESQFDMLKRLELSEEDFINIKKYCDKIGILFASTADEQDSLDFLIRIGIPFIKIGSGEITNIPYLRYIGSKNKPIILSTGMCTLEDVDLAVRTLTNAGASEITLLHCTTNYPCPFSEVNLKAMLTLKKHFAFSVGYSDHTKGIEVAIAAVALGASVIEKHFTLDCTMKGPDHLASTEPAEFKMMVDSIRKVELALGTGNKVPNNSEIIISKVVLRKIVASKNIKKGEVFTSDNLCVKRSNVGISSIFWDEIIGKTALNDYDIDSAIIIKGFDNE